MITPPAQISGAGNTLQAKGASQLPSCAQKAATPVVTFSSPPHVYVTSKICLHAGCMYGQSARKPQDTPLLYTLCHFLDLVYM